MFEKSSSSFHRCLNVLGRRCLLPVYRPFNFFVVICITNYKLKLYMTAGFKLGYTKIYEARRADH